MLISLFYIYLYIFSSAYIAYITLEYPLKEYIKLFIINML